MEPLPPGWTTAQVQTERERYGPYQLEARQRPTRGLLAAVLAAGLLYGLAEVAGSRWLTLGATACLALPVVALLLRPRVGALELTRTLHGTGAVGELVDTTLHVFNPGPGTTSALVVVDELPNHETLRLSVPALLPGGLVELRTSRAVVSRGRTLGGVLRLQAWSPVGVITATRDVPLGGEVRAHPARVPAPGAWRAVAVDAGGTRGSRPLPGTGADVLGLRPWRGGDAARSVSARATARHGRPLVLEREREQQVTLVLLVAGGGSGASWEALLARASALATQAVRAGEPLVLLGPPGPATPTAAQALEAFAAADWAPPLDADGVRRAVRAAGPGGRVVLVAPPGGAEALRDASRQFAAARCPLTVLEVGGPGA